MKLLDTPFLIQYWAGDETVSTYLEQNEESEFATTTLNIKELAVGRDLQGKLTRQEILTTFEWMTIVPFHIEHAFIAGELEAQLRRDESIAHDERTTLTADLLVAAVAKEMGATLVTENPDVVKRFNGVSVETY